MADGFEEALAKYEEERAAEALAKAIEEAQREGGQDPQ